MIWNSTNPSYNFQFPDKFDCWVRVSCGFLGFSSARFQDWFCTHTLLVLGYMLGYTGQNIITVGFYTYNFTANTISIIISKCLLTWGCLSDNRYCLGVQPAVWQWQISDASMVESLNLRWSRGDFASWEYIEVDSTVKGERQFQREVTSADRFRLARYFRVRMVKEGVSRWSSLQ